MSQLSFGYTFVRGWLIIVSVASVVVAHGCASTPQRNPAPTELHTLAEVPGVPRARFWGDEIPPLYEEVLEREASTPAVHSTREAHFPGLS